MKDNLEILVDLNSVYEFITSQKFCTFLIDNTENFETAAFILQTLLDEVEKLKE